MGKKSKNKDVFPSNLYDYVFQVNANQFKNFKNGKFKGTYMVHWTKTLITKEVI